MRVTRDEAIAHTAALAAATTIPVNADLEDCFADDPESVAVTIAAAAGTGAAGSVGRGTTDVTRHGRSASSARARPGGRGRGGRPTDWW